MREPTPKELAAVRDEGDFDPPSEPATRKRSSMTEAKPMDAYLPAVQRLLPQAPDAERGVLSSFLLNPGVGDLCEEEHVTSAHFHIPAHATIYSHLQSMRSNELPIDFISLTQFLRDAGRLDEVGGAAYITELFTFLPTAANARYYAEILHEKFTLREIVRVCTEYGSRGYDEQDDVPGLIDHLERDVLAIAHAKVADRNGCGARELATLGLTEIQRRIDLDGEISGLSTGFANLDAHTDGLHEQELIVVGAVPSVGKSALTMQIIEHLAIEQRVPCAVFPLEMGRKQLAQRMIYSRARVNPVPWRTGVRASDDDHRRMQRAAEEIAAAPLYVEDAADCTIQTIRATCRRLVRSHGVRVVLIDSLSALHSDTRQGRDNRVREAAECSEGCKQMAKELGITVILVAHIDRKKLRNEKPHVSDLRETGKVEQDADAIWFLYEPEFDAEKPSAEPEIQIWIPKQRDGEPFVSCDLIFQKRFTRFVEPGENAGQEEMRL